MQNLCLVCGYGQLYEPPVDERGISSDEICPCCGFHYGFDDDDIRDGIDVYEIWREEWVSGGCMWFSEGRKPPEDWNPVRQLQGASGSLSENKKN